MRKRRRGKTKNKREEIIGGGGEAEGREKKERRRRRWPCDVENGGGVCVRTHLFMRACGCLKKFMTGIKKKN